MKLPLTLIYSLGFNARREVMEFLHATYESAMADSENDCEAVPRRFVSLVFCSVLSDALCL